VQLGVRGPRCLVETRFVVLESIGAIGHEKMEMDIQPASYPLPTEVRDVILEKVDSEPGIEVVAMARYATAPEAGAQVILAAEVPVPHGFVDYIEGTIRSVSGPDAIVRVTILQAAAGVALEAPKIEEEEG